MHFMVIYGNKNNPVITQQIRRQAQARVHHVQPVGMKAAHDLRVAFGGLAGHFPVAFERVFKIILVHKIVARIVRRVDVDHLQPA